MTFYVVDTTISKGGKNPVLLFESTAGVVNYLEQMCSRKFRQSRKDYMINVESLGFGDDDPQGRSFYEQMEQYFQMGVIRNDSQPIRCNIFEADRFSKIKDAHGN